MKIKPEHYAQMKAAIAPLGDKISAHRESLRNDPRVNDLEKRVRWDMCHAAKLTPFICDTLYAYVNDTHIDTALRNIVQELEGKSLSQRTV